MRASRSQRHCNPRTYLTPRPPAAPVSAGPRIMDKGSEEMCPQLSPVQPGGQFATIAPNVNSNISVSQTTRRRYPFLSQNGPSGHDQYRRIETNTPPNSGQVYPLYYGIHCQNAESQMDSPVQGNIASNNIIVGRPIGKPIPEPAEMGSLQNLFSSSDVAGGDKNFVQQDIRHTYVKSSGTECDLSLRLGISDPCLHVEKTPIIEIEDVGPRSSQYGGKASKVFQHENKEFCFFPERTVNDHFESFSRKWFVENEGHELAATMRKRKAPFGGYSEDKQFFWQPGSSSNH